MASKSKSSTTRNRRKAVDVAVKQAELKQAQAKPTVKPVTGNVVVDRRLAFLPDAQRRKAVKEFMAGTPVAQLVKKYPIRRSVAMGWVLRQEAVESGLVKPIKPEDIAKVAKAGGEFTDFAWLACRARVSGGAVTKVLNK